MAMTKFREVRVGECFRYVDSEFGEGKAWYADTKKNERPALPDGWDVMDVDDKAECKTWWREHGDLEVEILEHYRLSPEPTVLTRGHIQVGECYQYVETSVEARQEAGGEKVIMLQSTGTWPRLPLPPGWRIGLISEKKMNHLPVRRVPHWERESEEVAIDVPAKLPVGTPLEQLLAEVVDEVTGSVCYTRLLVALRTESLCRRATGFVSTHGDAPLNEAQYVLATKVWEAKRDELRAATRARETPATILVQMHPDDELEDW